MDALYHTSKSFSFSEFESFVCIVKIRDGNARNASCVQTRVSRLRLRLDFGESCVSRLRLRLDYFSVQTQVQTQDFIYFDFDLSGFSEAERKKRLDAKMRGKANLTS